MTKKTAISVVIPNRNDARYLPQIVKMYLGQSLPPAEIIIVDDCSTDNSLHVIEDLAQNHPQIQYRKLEEHKGPCDAVQAGLVLATGQFIALTSANDIVEPKFLELSVRALEDHPSAGFCFSEPGEIDEGGARRTNHSHHISEVPAYFSPTKLKDILRRRAFTFSTNSTVYRRDAVMEVGGLRPELEHHADWFLTHVIASRHGVCFLPENLTYLRIHNDAYSSRQMKDTQKRRSVLHELMTLLGEDFRDVTAFLRDARIVPEYSLMMLSVMIANGTARRLMSPALLFRIMALWTWSFIRPFAPLSLRHQLKKRL